MLVYLRISCICFLVQETIKGTARVFPTNLLDVAPFAAHGLGRETIGHGHCNLDDRHPGHQQSPVYVWMFHDVCSNYICLWDFN